MCEGANVKCLLDGLDDGAVGKVSFESAVGSLERSAGAPDLSVEHIERGEAPIVAGG